MRHLLVVAAVALAAAFPHGAVADEPDPGKMNDLIQQLEQVVEGLVKRVARMEAALAQAVRSAEGAGLPGPVRTSSSASPSGTPAAGAAASPILETYDRFTGERTLFLESDPVQATHKNDKSNTLPMRFLWEIYQEDDKGVFHQLYIETQSDDRLWPEGTLVYILEDEHRKKIELAGYLAARNGVNVEYVSLRFRESALKRFTDSEKVELRVGVWELEVPKPFRQLVAEANRRAKAPPRDG